MKIKNALDFEKQLLISKDEVRLEELRWISSKINDDDEKDYDRAFMYKIELERVKGKQDLAITKSTDQLPRGNKLKHSMSVSVNINNLNTREEDS